MSGDELWARASIELTTASIADINEAFSAGALTSERLTQLYVRRIEAYDKKGPALNAILILNPHALDDARALDAERKSKGPRGPLHGIPVLLKANIETAGLPATAGFYGLRDSIANRDAEVTRRLRAAGCVILGLTNMSEFATGPAISTLGGQIRNPHALDRSPQGSSGGSAAAIAARFATFSIGTDTGGSVRGPAAVTGIAGLRPSLGLVGRGGIIPLALSLDTAGPMAPSVADLAIVLNVIVGADPRDPAVADREPVDYRSELSRATLRGARLGLIRDYMGADSGADAVIEQAVQVLRAHGAEVIDVPLPRFIPGLVLGSYEAIRDAEFRVQIEAYLASLPGAGLPRTHADIIQLGTQLVGKPSGGEDLFVRGTTPSTIGGAVVIEVRDNARATAAFGRIVGLLERSGRGTVKPASVAGAGQAFRVATDDFDQPLLIARGKGPVGCGARRGRGRCGAAAEQDARRGPPVRADGVCLG